MVGNIRKCRAMIVQGGVTEAIVIFLISPALNRIEFLWPVTVWSGAIQFREWGEYFISGHFEPNSLLYPSDFHATGNWNTNTLEIREATPY